MARLDDGRLERRIETLVLRGWEAERYEDAQGGTVVAYKKHHPEHPTVLTGVMVPNWSGPVERNPEPSLQINVNGAARVTWPLYDLVDRWARPSPPGMTDHTEVLERLAADWRGLLLPPSELRLGPRETLLVRVCDFVADPTWPVPSIYVQTLRYVRREGW